ncbi:MAG TPA: NAD-dependent epimerase/dehydratase family protein [Bellilinea sp.]|nr:NAD-dependent epimerase/dehydratase family protein [Bellilinea sp.]
MILVTGGTGFIGRTLVRHLIAGGQEVRTLLKPSKSSPQLPRGIAVEAAVSSLLDERSLRAALRDVDTVFHLAGNERHSSHARLQEVDIQGTQVLAEVAAAAGVKRIVYLSHLGADQYSAFSVFKAKGLAEQAIIQSGVPYTIFRSGVVFGPGDQFTTNIARILRTWPGPFLLPGDGSSLVQPLWIEDLVAAMMISYESPSFVNQVISIGGVEALPFRQVVEIVMQKIGVQRLLSNFSPPYLRMLGLMLEQFARAPISIFWLDYLAADRTTNLDTVPRVFGILPARFHTQLDYLVYRRGRPALKKGLI